MAKLFGYCLNSANKSSSTDLQRMMLSFKIFFQNHLFIESEQFAIGTAILNKYDCQIIKLKSKSIELIFMGNIFSPGNNKLFLKKIIKAIEFNNSILLKTNLRNLNGIFLIFAYDHRRKSAHIISDRYGMEPIFYYYDKKKLVFASEIKAILTDPTIKGVVNWDFWNDFFQYGYAMGDKTPFKKIYPLPSGSFLTYQNGKMNISKYWDYDLIKINHNLKENEAIKLGIKVLKNVFKRQTKNLKKCLVLLSGGFDSRCISCSLQRFTKTKFENYSSDLHPSTGNQDYLFARKVSESLGVKNTYLGKPKYLYKTYFKEHFLIVDGLCTEHKWFPPITESIKDNLPNFDGIGGDVMLRGPFLTPDNIKQFDSKKLTKFFNKQITVKGGREKCALIYKLFSPDFAKKLKPDRRSMLKEFENLGKIENKVTIFYLKNRTKNSISLLPRSLLGRKIYSYFPFFDNEFVEYALGLPPHLKLFGKLYFEILKTAFPKVMEIPTTNDIYLKKNILDIEVKSSLKQSVVIDEDMNYLLHLLKTISFPKFIDKNSLQNQVGEDIKNNINPKKYLVSVLQFCIWFNNYRPSVTWKKLS